MLIVVAIESIKHVTWQVYCSLGVHTASCGKSEGGHQAVYKEF